MANLGNVITAGIWILLLPFDSFSWSLKDDIGVDLFARQTICFWLVNERCTSIANEHAEL